MSTKPHETPLLAVEFLVNEEISKMGVHSSNDDDLRTSNTKNGVCEERADNAAKVVLCHDDVAVLGDEDHLRYHAVMYLKDTPRPPLSRRRTNFTFREPG